MTKLRVEFAGLPLENPFLLASGPPTRDENSINKALEAGWAGAVTKSISLQPTPSPSPRLYLWEALDSLVNIELISEFTPLQWMRWIKNLKKKFPKKPIIASIMASTRLAEWQDLARRMQDAGADALELNVSCPHGMPERAMGSLIGQDKNLLADIISAVKKSAKIPVLVKLTPNVTDLVQIARACEKAGADGLSGINTVKALAGIDINTGEPKLSVRGLTAFGGYGGKGIKPIALRCVAEMVLSTHLPVSASGGILTWADAVEFLLIGATTVQVATAAILYGTNIIEEFTSGLDGYLKNHRLSSVRSLIGRAKDKIVKHSALPLTKDVPVFNPKRCVRNCQTCIITCNSSGVNALRINKRNLPAVDLSLCAGCGLCVSVCPYQAIVMRPRHKHKNTWKSQRIPTASLTCKTEC